MIAASHISVALGLNVSVANGFTGVIWLIKSFFLKKSTSSFWKICPIYDCPNPACAILVASVSSCTLGSRPISISR